MSLVDCTTIGNPPQLDPDKAATIRVDIFDFLNRKEKRGEYFETRTMIAHGYPWKIRIFPRGDQESEVDWVPCFLIYDSDAHDRKEFPVDAKAIFRVNNSCGVTATIDGVGKGFRNWLHWNDACKEEVLTIEIDISVEKQRKSIWYPNEALKDTSDSKLRKLHGSSKSSDVTFIVGTKQRKFKCHRCIIEMSSPYLYGLVLSKAEEIDDIDTTAAKGETAEQKESEQEGISSEGFVPVSSVEENHDDDKGDDDKEEEENEDAPARSTKNIPSSVSSSAPCPPKTPFGTTANSVTTSSTTDNNPSDKDSSDDDSDEDNISSDEGTNTVNNSEGLGDIFKIDVDSWRCDICSIRNNDSANRCVACENLRPGAEDATASNTETVKAAPGSSASIGAGGFSFGGTTATSSAIGAGGFSFGGATATDTKTSAIGAGGLALVSGLFGGGLKSGKQNTTQFSAMPPLVFDGGGGGGSTSMAKRILKRRPRKRCVSKQGQNCGSNEETVTPSPFCTFMKPSEPLSIELPGVSEVAFDAVVKFLYTGTEPKYVRRNENSAKDMLLLADKIDCTHLKLYAESVLAERFLDTSNAADMILFADAHSCALLKEAAMGMYATDPKTVRKTEGYTKLMESKDLVIELLDYTNGERGEYVRVADRTPEEDVDNLDVTSLRERLQSVSIHNVDGSKEMLVRYWKDQFFKSTGS